jgi:membrane fusion protein, multidrug efflux system
MHLRKDRWGKWAEQAAVLVFLLSLGNFVSGCSKQKTAPRQRPAVPVVVAKVTEQTVPIDINAVGNVEAYSAVAIKSQVSGVLLEVHFKEGDFVHQGQKLITIDPRPYQAALAQAQAAVTRDKAIAVNNRLQAERYEKLLADGVVPAQQVDTYKSAADASDAVVTADEAAVKTAQLNLDYCTINSPIDGRTGTLMLKPGNLLKVADVPIVVINQVNPIYVNFTVPQQYWPEIKKYTAQGTLRVSATVPQDPGPPEVGRVTFVDNEIDTTTGTIHLRGTFSNSQHRLWPGLFVNVSLRLFDRPNAIVVPAQAVSQGQNGALVYVLKNNNTVEARRVVSTRRVGDLALIDEGLKPGETVVVDGQLQLAPGAKVSIKNKLSEADGETSPAGPPELSNEPLGTANQMPARTTR